MDSTDNQRMPLARQEELLVHELIDEVLVYDLMRYKAHSLNRTAALVWRHCDGQSSVTKVTRLLEHELETSVDESVIWLALHQLDKAKLLGEAPQLVENPSLSRREVMRRLGWSAAAALPLITSVLAPPAQAQASACAAKGAPCTSPPQCCPGCSCTGSNKCAGSCA